MRNSELDNLYPEMAALSYDQLPVIMTNWSRWPQDGAQRLLPDLLQEFYHLASKPLIVGEGALEREVSYQVKSHIETPDLTQEAIGEIEDHGIVIQRKLGHLLNHMAARGCIAPGLWLVNFEI